MGVHSSAPSRDAPTRLRSRMASHTTVRLAFAAGAALLAIATLHPVDARAGKADTKFSTPEAIDTATVIT